MTPATNRIIVTLIAGILFGFGLSMSGMLDPTRVVGFLDIGSGNWDPSLAFVLGGAVLVAGIGVAIQRGMRRPLLDTQFHLPPTTPITTRLIAGSALFGAGWGAAGFCPGPVITALSTGLPAAFIFVAAMAFGMVLHDRMIVRYLHA